MLLRREKGQTSVTSVCDVNDIVVHDKGSNCNKSRNTLKPIWTSQKPKKEVEKKNAQCPKKKRNTLVDANPCILSITRQPWRGEDKPETLAWCSSISYEEIFWGGNDFELTRCGIQTMSEGSVVVSVTDGEQPFGTWDGGEEDDKLMLCLFESAWALTPPIAPPTIAPMTDNTTRPITRPPFFVCQKGWRLEVTAKFPKFLASTPLRMATSLSVFELMSVTQIRLEINRIWYVHRTYLLSLWGCIRQTLLSSRDWAH